MLNKIKSFLILHFWENPLALKNFLEEVSEEKMNHRCELCGLFMCQHTTHRRERAFEPPSGSRSSNSEFSVGNSIPDVMEDFSGVIERPSDPETKMSSFGTPYRNPIIREAPSTIPMAFSSETSRVIIPPPPAVPNISGAPVDKSLQNIDLKNDFVICNICKARVFIRYLDQHLKVHTHNFAPTPSVGMTSTAIVRVPVVNSTTSTNLASTTSKPKASGPQLSPIETYKFRPLDQACAASSVSKNGRYSDFTIVFWGKEKTTVHTNSYVGSPSSYTSGDWERFSIHIVYDSMEDYYTITSKLLKRSSHSSWDQEDTIPDRICFQEELFTEIKRALLFFKISPKAAYKHFRKLFNQDLIIDYDDGRASIVQTKNSQALTDKIKKSSNFSYSPYHDYD